MEILSALATTILGIILSQIVSHWETWRQTANRSDLRGDWLALDCFDAKDIFVEKVTISRKFGKFYLKNYKNKAGQLWDAYCTAEDPGLLVGNWRSLRPGATTKGRILLIINPQATFLYGVYSGHTEDGRDSLLRWVLARDDDSLRRAATLLKMTIPENIT